MPCVLLIVATACGGGQTTYRPPTSGDQGDHNAADFAFEDDFKPTYGKPELEKALIAERGAEAKLERVVLEFEAGGQNVSGSDVMRVAVSDLAVRRRFIADLELCESQGHHCPPRLDDPSFNFDYDEAGIDPPLDNPLRFDLESWRKIAVELHGRACACRTEVCLDAVGVAIDQLERKPIADVQGDETASDSITRARECLFRLRGKQHR